MTIEDFRETLRRLYVQRGVIEEELAERSVRLAEAGVGMDVPLVDSEGFPRADVDIAAIRADRQRIAELRNDHRSLQDELERALHSLHAVDRQPGPPRAQSPVQVAPSFAAAAAVTLAPATAEPLRAFAVAERVAQGSPAEHGGLREGDELVRFATITSAVGSADPLRALADLLPVLENKDTEVVVLREGERKNLVVVPQIWPGRGLLGVFWRLTRQIR